ncbi:fibrinogen beta chain-like [Babylonia areolata]|uniref:fibrinogen beta chain-like n=1 Tax=Babylonia areolata TaxID=304850 RepID=UPI003FD5BDE4
MLEHGPSTAFCTLLRLTAHRSQPDGLPYYSQSGNTDSAEPCRSRPCTDTEVCTPMAPTPKLTHVCLPFPSHCGEPSVAMATLTWSGTSQGHVANVTCDPYHVLTPGMPSVLTCGVTSVWGPVGVACESFRDCGEMEENGHTTDGIFHIQPVSSPYPFKVRCKFTVYSAVTFALRHRYDLTFHARDWATLKYGILGDLELSTDPWDFFLGLDRLHELTQQAQYEALVVLWVGFDGASAHYDGFRVASENASYELTFSGYSPRARDGKGDNGLNGKAPVTFSSLDRDPSKCASKRGASGWYGTDCNGYSFFATPVVWSIFGVDEKCQALEVKLIRTGGFY